MVKFISFLKLIRWPNLAIIALVQYLIKFTIIENGNLGVPHVLSLWQFSLGVLCSIALAASGYIINDIYDLNADQRNKPGRMVVGKAFTIRSAWIMYVVVNLVAVISGYLVAYYSGFNDLWLIPVVAMALLYLYSIDLKKRAVLGNLVVSLLVGLPVFFTAVFDVLPAANEYNSLTVKVAFQVISAFAIFAFYTNFIREVIKDGEDIEGDQAEGYRTLAVLLGRDHLRYVILSLIVILLIFTGAYNMFLFQGGTDIYSSIYILIFVNVPILLLMWFILNAQTKEHYKRASLLTKVIMLTGIFSMVIFTLATNISA